MRLRLIISIIAAVIIFIFSATALLHWWIKSLIDSNRRLEGNSGMGACFTFTVMFVAVLVTRYLGECNIIRLPKEEAVKSEMGVYKHGAVASDVYECSKLGRQILERNGSAVDASIVATLCACLYNPHSCGIGGGHISVIYLKKERKAVVIDAREAAPLKATSTMFKDQFSSLFGGLAISVPGEIAGFYEAHKIAGRLPWKDLFSPIIDLCEHGIRVSKFLAFLLPHAEPCIRSNSYLSRIFINEDTNQTVSENEIIKFPELAKTLQKISETNVREFYSGDLSKVIVEEINLNDGIFTLADLKNYTARVKKPITVSLKNGYSMILPPPPSSAIAASFVVQLMSKFDLNKDVFNNTEKEALYYHRLIEAFKFATVKKNQLADDSFYNMQSVIDQLTSEKYIEKIFAKINDSSTFDTSYYSDDDKTQSSPFGTTHTSVLAPDGDAVSISASVNQMFGSCVTGSKTGIIYNDHMADFTIDFSTGNNKTDKSINRIEARKRPLSSMAPIIILDEYSNVRLVIGASGGAKIFTNVASIIFENLFLGRNIKEAISGFKVHHQLNPSYVQLESLKDLPQHIREGLEQRGHTFGCNFLASSVAQGIEVRFDGEIWAHSDGRKGGETDGF